MKKRFIFLMFCLILSSSLLSVNAQSLEDLKLINLRSNFASVSEVKNDQERKLYQKNADAKMYPASMTKMLTIYTALLYGPSFDTQVVIEEVDIANLREMNASIAGLYVGDVMTFEDLLYGIMLPSGADASNAVARVVSGSIEEFTKLMNETAQSIGMNSSQFTSATGLYDENHYSTANDIALLAQTALKNDQF